jgi:hypothetical protein
MARRRNDEASTEAVQRLRSYWEHCLDSCRQEHPDLATYALALAGLTTEEGEHENLFHPLEQIAIATRLGIVPPPEALMAVTKAFNAYQRSKGKLSLEEAFFGRPKQRGGNWSKRESQRREHDKYVMAMAFLQVTEGMSGIQAATTVSKHSNKNADPFSLGRLFRKKRGKALANVMRDIREGKSLRDNDDEYC